MKISLKNYTLRYLTLAFLLILAVWAAVFYAYILDEVYDNIDDGLKDKKNAYYPKYSPSPRTATNK